MNHILGRFINTIPKEFRGDFENEIIELDLHRSFIMGLLILLMELSIFGISFIPSIQVNYENYLWIYRGLYLTIIIYTSLYLGMRFIGKRFFEHKTKLNLRLLNVSATVFISYSALITIIDQYRGINSLVYLFISMAIAIVFISRPIDATLFYGISLLIYILGSLWLEPDNNQLFSYLLNTICMIVTAWTISVALYNSYSKSYMKNKVISDQKAVLEKIILLDPMTGLFNRRGLSSHLARYYQEALDKGETIGVFMIDIDYFKGLNDVYGHDQGDQVITQIAEELMLIAESYHGIACRYGGDEICLVLPRIPLEEGEQLSRMFSAMIVGLSIENKASLSYDYVTISCGHFVGLPKINEDAWAFITKADKGLYEVKRARG